MADQNQNPNPNPNRPAQANIDDLVKELSRPTPSGASAPQRPTSPPSPPAPPKPAMPPPSPAKPITPPTPAASVTTPTKPVSPVNSGSRTPATQPYQSNIRTMADDLTSLKSGQQPQGTNVPRTPAPAPSPVRPTPTPAPAPQKPPMTAPMANMPKAKPSMPLPSFPKPSLPSTPPSPPARPVPPPANLGAPSKPSPNIPNKQIFTPETSSSGGSKRNLLFAAIGVVVVVFGLLYWLLVIRPGGEVAQVPLETATPTPTATPRIPVSSLFSRSVGSIALDPNTDPLQTFTNGLKTIVVPAGQLGILAVTDPNTNQTLTPFQLMDRLVVSYPVDLKPGSSDQDGVILAYGQTEAFNSNGQSIQGQTPPTHLAFVARVSNSAAASMRSWETTISNNLSTVFNVSASKNTGPFLDVLYRGTAVRYKNFSYPDMAIDYAIIQFNGAPYLVMANSREAMFATLDIFTPPGK